MLIVKFISLWLKYFHEEEKKVVTGVESLFV